MLGDRWSLLIVRDMMVRGFSTFKEFVESDEGIATNILADRLKRLEEYGIVVGSADPGDGRKSIYRLTQKGIDLAPVLTEMVLWAARHEQTGNQALVRALQTDREAFLNKVREQWSAATVEALRAEEC
jgi:DNA-binding HxlR family transcriptional regulator